ncbi:hypothetical protein E4T56_gene4830 [Termitomyces sp. T112]|nr:hypothetical protein E4T56_gene4830 [Termitomyces sp. T112]
MSGPENVTFQLNQPRTVFGFLALRSVSLWKIQHFRCDPSTRNVSRVYVLIPDEDYSRECPRNPILQADRATLRSSWVQRSASGRFTSCLPSVEFGDVRPRQCSRLSHRQVQKFSRKRAAARSF